jgi:filamentous hemagglutinin
VTLAKAGIRVGAERLEKMADMAKIAKAEASAGKPMDWTSVEGAYSKKLEGGYGPGTTTFNGKVVENPGEYSVGAKATVDKPARALEQLLPDGKVPSVRGGEFNRWFDELSSAELDVLWQNKAARDAIEARIRQPGGLHEWCMVCRTPDFKKWGVPMEEIQRFRTKTTELKWISPIDGKPGGHGGYGSGTFHNELKAVIDNSKSLDEFNLGIISLQSRWKIDPDLLPPLPKAGGK